MFDLAWLQIRGNYLIDKKQHKIRILIIWITLFVCQNQLLILHFSVSVGNKWCCMPCCYVVWLTLYRQSVQSWDFVWMKNRPIIRELLRDILWYMARLRESRTKKSFLSLFCQAFALEMDHKKCLAEIIYCLGFGSNVEISSELDLSIKQ